MQIWSVQDPQVQAEFRQRAGAADIVYVEGVQSAEAAAALAAAAAPTLVAFDCALQLQALGRLGGMPLEHPG